MNKSRGTRTAAELKSRLWRSLPFWALTSTRGRDRALLLARATSRVQALNHTTSLHASSPQAAGTSPLRRRGVGDPGERTSHANWVAQRPNKIIFQSSRHLCRRRRHAAHYAQALAVLLGHRHRPAHGARLGLPQPARARHAAQTKVRPACQTVDFVLSHKPKCRPRSVSVSASHRAKLPLPSPPGRYATMAQVKGSYAGDIGWNAAAGEHFVLNRRHGAPDRQGLTLVHIAAQLEHLRYTSMG